VPVLLLKDPVAVHVWGDGHDTASSSAPVEPGGVGVGWIVQTFPSQRSTSVPDLPVLSVDRPTAVHACGVAHDIPDSSALVAPGGAGVGWIFHALPFHRSVNVDELPVLSVDCPTAIHARRDAHATPCRTLDVEPGGFGVG
jgi:hypothetical protein